MSIDRRRLLLAFAWLSLLASAPGIATADDGGEGGGDGGGDHDSGGGVGGGPGGDGDSSGKGSDGGEDSGSDDSADDGDDGSSSGSSGIGSGEWSRSGRDDHREAARAVERGWAKSLGELRSEVQVQFGGEIIGVEIHKNLSSVTYRFKVIDRHSRLLSVDVNARTKRVIRVEGR